MNKKKLPLYKGILAGVCLSAMLGISAITATISDNVTNKPITPPIYYPVVEEKEYTLMLYIIGSDLESAYGAATDNINELKDIDTQSINIVGEGGGSMRWHTNGLTPQSNTRFTIENGEVIITSKKPSQSMGDASNLADFIAFARDSYPAEKYILALWNHGDGPIGGFGSDELFGGDSILLNELSSALSAADCKNKPIDIIGFDACCMASVETALCVEPFADYMIASQEIEPAGGWDYTVMDTLSGLSAENAAKKISLSYYEKALNSYSGATISVTDLSLLSPLKKSIDDTVFILQNMGYESFSQKRGNMVGFGGEGRAKGQSDFVDLKSFFDAVGAPNANEALENAIVLTKSGDAAASGLNLYAPYSELSNAFAKLEIYKSSNILAKYADYSADFANYILAEQLLNFSSPPITSSSDIISMNENSENIKQIYMTAWEQDEAQPNYYYMTGTDSDIYYDGESYIYEIDNEWTFLGGQPLCTLELQGLQGIATRFACPVLINSQRANLILHYDRETPYGKALYAVMLSENGKLTKQIRPLFNGDEITPLYPIEAFADDTDEIVAEYITDIEGYKIGEAFVYRAEMPIEALSAAENALYGFWLTTFQNDEYFSDFTQAS